MSALPKRKHFVFHKAWKYSLCDTSGMVMNLKTAFFRKWVFYDKERKEYGQTLRAAGLFAYLTAGFSILQYFFSFKKVYFPRI